ncbi:hypothetical protein BDV95DRAFT_507954 [Massariosphaeria phaeospora]|uniref:Glycosyltransferase family 25 protein n=1 Tax=Massariosphaeria phaeospora TaxID=100035 RepID=A0A7C8M1E1_9PLEO|nr:hypothetical protein BDV95DRAFT_507954 [Massariosphaeria phaeospora]
MLASRKRPVPLLLALTFFLAVLYYRNNADRIQWTSPSIEPPAEIIPANRTLGFGAIVAVSKERSDRRHSLLQAANVTDIDLTIPKQPVWTEGDVTNFRNGQVEGVQRGSILAWMGHHNALRWFLDSGLETALILEDDVDWDIRLRSVQIPLAASAARTLLSPRPRSRFAKTPKGPAEYWGDHREWDLLYLGHCGDYFNEVTEDGLVPIDDTPFNLSTMSHVVYEDPSLPVRSDLHPFTQDLFRVLRMPHHTRAFHRSRFPLCSFGYAVTRPAAERLLSDLAPPKLRKKGPRAFDVALLHACSKGENRPSPGPPGGFNPKSNPGLTKHTTGLRCWTLNSELFHHMPGESMIARIGEAMGEELGIPPVDLAGQAQTMYRDETTNIDCGFWSGAFDFQDGDMERLNYLQEEVGRKGKCLKEGRDTEEDSTD